MVKAETEGISHTRIEIDLAAIAHNIDFLQKKAPGAGFMAVIKANAYGHGIIDVARAIEKKVSAFAVSKISEGVSLRKAGIKKMVLVFGVPVKGQTEAYSEYNLTATISALSHFELLPDGCSYHLNFDTGMGRLGLYEGEITETKEAMARHKQLKCTGIYSHFATAEDAGSEKTVRQISLFKSIRKEFPQELLAHLANTGGVLFYPGSHFDMLRAGIGIYGYAPGNTAVPGLKPSLALKSKIVQVKAIAKGQTVSYGARWAAPYDGFLGVVSAGYSDGIPRNLSGKFRVKIDGHLFPAVGTITMNYCMVFLGQEEVKVGTDVEFINIDELGADRWASALDTIPYEILCRLPGTIRREYSI